uniref:NFACT RNA binding domain-containing protein n=1 Tax=Candidatus Scatousia sp. TaxID=3085663 RepID=UPI0040254B15
MPVDGAKQTKHKAIEPEKIDINGFTIFIGKNNRQNDYIISKLAKDEDIWFHTKDCAGSHVLLKGLNPPDELILHCAKLAKEHSSASTSSKIGVIYTKRKYLRKPPKANLGYVTYKNEKEIIID